MLCNYTSIPSGYKKVSCYIEVLWKTWEVVKQSLVTCGTRCRWSAEVAAVQLSASPLAEESSLRIIYKYIS
jgi:hypothetical protein